MANTAPVTEEEARAIIQEWARLHDLQAGLSAFLPFIASDGFYMQFGGKRWVGYADFEDHQITKRRFFDEKHEYFDIQVTPGEEKTIARSKMHWTYRFRPERSPTSKLIKAYIEHIWEFRRCPKTGRAFMQGHIVDLFEYEKGFRPDDEPQYDPHIDTRWQSRG
jgi:hypothetical protein